MGKGTTFIGQPVLNQVVNLMSKDKINILADEKGTDRYTKHLDSYTHLVIMLYAVLTNSSSLREVVLGFESNVSRMGHLGMDYLVRRSTLEDANKRRAPAFFEAVYDYLYRLYEPVLSDSHTKRELLDKLYVMDSTTISLSLRYLILTFHRANQEEEDPSQAGLLFVSSTSATILRPRGVEVVGKG